MPIDPRKRQKAIMKKRSKQKAAQHKLPHQGFASTASSQSIIRNARSFPLVECWISGDWQKKNLGLVEIIVAREQPDGQICFGLYLVDYFCLGLKNTLARTDLTHAQYQKEARKMLFHDTEPEICSAELAHQFIYAAIDYAAQFGFTPDKGFELTQHILAPRGELAEPYALTFGQDGKPFFVSGPRDDAKQIIKQLERTAGPGNYDYIAIANPF